LPPIVIVQEYNTRHRLHPHHTSHLPDGSAVLTVRCFFIRETTPETNEHYLARMLAQRSDHQPPDWVIPVLGSTPWPLPSTTMCSFGTEKRSCVSRLRLSSSSLQWQSLRHDVACECRQHCLHGLTELRAVLAPGWIWKRFNSANQTMCSSDRPGDFLFHHARPCDCTPPNLIPARVHSTPVQVDA